ncbi:hypothetical protein D3C76_1681010 [compost metagenome]
MLICISKYHLRCFPTSLQPDPLHVGLAGRYKKLFANRSGTSERQHINVRMDSQSVPYGVAETR